MKQLLVLFLFLLLAQGLLEAQEDKPAVQEVSNNITTTSHLLMDPGKMTEENKQLFRTSDGTSAVNMTYNPEIYQTVTYSKTTLTEESEKINKDGKEFFEGERQRRLKFFEKYNEGKADTAELQEFQKEERQRRQEFARKRQAKIDVINCKGVKTPTCDEIRSRSKKFFGIF